MDGRVEVRIGSWVDKNIVHHVSTEPLPWAVSKTLEAEIMSLVKDNLRSSGLPFHVSIEKSYCCKNCKCYPKQIQPLTQLPQNLSESKGYNYISVECQNPTNRSAKHNLDNKKKHTDNTSAKRKCYHIGIEIRYFCTGSHKFSESIILLILRSVNIRNKWIKKE